MQGPNQALFYPFGPEFCKFKKIAALVLLLH